MSVQCDWVGYQVMVLTTWFPSGAALNNCHECTLSQVVAVFHFSQFYPTLNIVGYFHVALAVLSFRAFAFIARHNVTKQTSILHVYNTWNCVSSCSLAFIYYRVWDSLSYFMTYFLLSASVE